MDKKKVYKNPDLPTKICAACGKPMAWRKRGKKIGEKLNFARSVAVIIRKASDFISLLPDF